MATCPHAERLIPLLHDGELASPLRRHMHSHLVTCLPCSRTLSALGRGQELLSQMIDEEIEKIDFSNFWQGIENKLGEPRPSWTIRFRLWIERWHLTQPLYAPAWAVVAVLLLTVGAFLNPIVHSPNSSFPQFASQQSSTPSSRGLENSPAWNEFDSSLAFVSNQAQIESIDSSDTVAVWNDPSNNSTVIWIGNDTSEGMP